MAYDYSAPLSNALLNTTTNGLRPTLYDPLFTDFEPITTNRYSYLNPDVNRTSYLNSTSLANEALYNGDPFGARYGGPTNRQQFNNTNRNNNDPFLNDTITQLNTNRNAQQNRGAVGGGNDLNINIHVDPSVNKNSYPNSILQQQHQLLKQKQQQQNQYFNSQKQLKGGLGSQFDSQQQQQQQQQQRPNYEDLEELQQKQQPLFIRTNNNFNNNNNNFFDNNNGYSNNNNNSYSNNYSNNNNNNTNRHRQQAEENNSITSTDAEPIPSASPNRGKNNVHEKLYQDAFDVNGSYLNAMKEAKTRDKRLAKRQYSQSDYKIYEKNFGFGNPFLGFENETKEEKAEKAKIRNEYSKLIKERNTVIIDEQRKYNDINPLFLPKRGIEFDVSKRKRNDELNASQGRYPTKHQAGIVSKGIKEFEKLIKEEHDANCTCGFHDSYLSTAPNSTDRSVRIKLSNMQKK